MGACHTSTGAAAPDQVRGNETALTRIHVALAGQPNVGKSTVFNLLTGLNQHVGNWPGKTVEQKTGFCTRGDIALELVDLPGTYSLTANSPEELIARDYLLTQKPDVVIAVVDAAILERSLYLVAELVQLGLPLVVGLNMLDVAAQNGIRINTQALSAALGVPVFDLIAAKGVGVEPLITAAIDAAVQHPMMISGPRLSPKLDRALDEIERSVAAALPEVYPLHWAALKLQEGDRALIDQLRPLMDSIEFGALKLLLKAQPDAALSIAGARYAWIASAVKAAVTRTPTTSMTLTARLDRAATHPVWGLGVLAAVLGLLFALTYAIGQPAQNWLDVMVIHGLSNAASTLLATAPVWLRGLIVDGVIGGAGTVLTFVPILVFFFAGMALLEDVGYMARAAYLMDGFMRLMGLHGKSFLPLFLGLGCNVPSITGTRVIEADKARLMTIVLMPLVPCTARMAVVAFMTPAFFGAAAPLVALGLVALNLSMLAVVGVILSRTLMKSEHNAFIMELPLYHLPNARTIGLLVWQRTLGFIKHAGTLILIMALAVWALSVIPTGNVETSLLGQIGQWLSPLGNLMGLSWQLLVALLASFVAKENSIATLGILFGTGDNALGLAATLSTVITPAAALSFLVVQLLFIPCAATIGAIKAETHSWKWTLFTIGLLATISFGAGIIVYQVASRLVA
ncbi:MAG: ferrous iron transport protein B [Thermoflexales bacterium]|nr:ferrous iron transport protein B [Thermoflexales bacterium]